jgi:2-amino-4-hydroxy-6-hydroxymethyldihydropteridine diphosphokinase
MQNTPCVIAFGANLGDRQATFAKAAALLAAQVGSIQRTSSLIETAALVLPGEDPLAHPPYLNAAWLISTSLRPRETLQQLLLIEKELGRIREKRWAPRTIDLDLIAHDQAIVSSVELTLPHPEMHKRSFVLGPMMEIYPEWRHPVLGRSVAELLSSLRIS